MRSAPPQEIICKASPHKRRYATEQLAKNALALNKYKREYCGQERRKERRAFFCPHCSGYHLTSRWS